MIAVATVLWQNDSLQCKCFSKKADRASATEYAVDEKKIFTSDGISGSGEDVLEDAIPAIQSDENTSNEQQIDMCKIASYSERSQLSAEKKFHILTNRDTLPHNFQVPGPLEKLGCQRHFPAKWLQHYSWVEYSVMANGGFCVPCMLFGIRSDHADLGVLVSKHRDVAAAPQTPQLGGPGQLWGPKLV